MRPAFFRSGPSAVQHAADLYAGPAAGAGSSIRDVDVAMFLLAFLDPGGPWKYAAPVISNK